MSILTRRLAELEEENKRLRALVVWVATNAVSMAEILKHVFPDGDLPGSGWSEGNDHEADCECTQCVMIREYRDWWAP
jgi:hypothetical protein